MPPPHPLEFRRRAVELARERAKPIAQIAADIGISESCLRKTGSLRPTSKGHKEGLTAAEREELVKLRRENRVLRMEKEILEKPRPFFATWQRGTNENTNGLLRQYFPKGTDLSRWRRNEVEAVAAALNARPRKTLGWKTSAEALHEHLRSLQQAGVATIG